MPLSGRKKFNDYAYLAVVTSDNWNISTIMEYKLNAKRWTLNTE